MILVSRNIRLPYMQIFAAYYRGLFPLRLRIALHGERYRDADSVSISLATQHATQRVAVMEISLKGLYLLTYLVTYLLILIDSVHHML